MLGFLQFAWISIIETLGAPIIIILAIIKMPGKFPPASQSEAVTPAVTILNSAEKKHIFLLRFHRKYSISLHSKPGDLIDDRTGEIGSKA